MSFLFFCSKIIFDLIFFSDYWLPGVHCNKVTTRSRKAWFSDLPEILIVHLKRFKREENITRNDYLPVIHGDNISILVMQDSEVLAPIQVPFRLGAVINHRGPFDRGHDWTNVRCNGSEDWVLYNDQAVIRDSNQKNPWTLFTLTFQYVQKFELSYHPVQWERLYKPISPHILPLTFFNLSFPLNYQSKPSIGHVNMSEWISSWQWRCS